MVTVGRRRAQRAADTFGARVSGNDVTLLHDGGACFAAMLDSIGAARSEVLLEMYWFGSDATGWRFAEALAEKARSGVAIHVIYDAVGSWDTDSSVFHAMRRAGCTVHEYHPVAPWRHRFNIGVLHNRDHRKMMVVDGRIGFTGGINIGDLWAPESDGGDGWRDDMIRIEGPAAEVMRDLFMQTWDGLEAEGPAVRPRQALPAPEPTEGGSPVRILSGGRSGRPIRRWYLDRIEGATQRIYITNSYFAPDGQVRRALARAGKRGVDVRVLVPWETDMRAVHYAGRAMYGRLMSAGVRVYQWMGPILHAKSATIDGRWGIVGSYNLDWRSWRFNLEVAAVVEDREVARGLERRFELDLEGAAPIVSHIWRYRPVSERLAEQFFYLFRKLL